VRRLRAKLGDALPLETLRGSGYTLRAPSELPQEEELPSLARAAPVRAVGSSEASPRKATR
jgi:hypothetical protein